MCYARLPIFFILFFTDVTRSSDCIVSLYEVSVWAVSFSWHRGLSRPLLWFRISTLVFNWVNNYQNTEDFGNTANVDLTYCLSILCCFLFSSFTDNSFNLTFSVYSGHHTILIPPGDLETNPALWLSVVSQYKGEFCSLLWMILLPNPTKKVWSFADCVWFSFPVRDTFCSYPVMDLCTKGLGQSIPALKVLWIVCFKEDMFRGRYQIDFSPVWKLKNAKKPWLSAYRFNVVSLGYKACGKIT